MIGFTRIEVLVACLILMLLTVAALVFKSELGWKKENYCSKYGVPFNTVRYQKFGDVMIPTSSTITPCIEWRRYDPDQLHNNPLY